MTSADTEAMTALQELLDERQRYEGWIVGLEQRKSITAQHVYERVHTDYTLRLERVLHRLSERTEQLQSTAQVMASRLAALRSRESDRIDARQEAELRASVGEYTDEEWTKLRDDADSEIMSIAEERRAVEAELAEIERIIELTRGPRGEISDELALEAPIAAEAAVEDRDVSIVADTHPSIQEFVADSHVPLTAVASAAQPALSSDLSRQPDQSQTALSLETQSVQSGSAVSPAMESRRDQEKTLKCPECSTLNYATEWYCERCGGELATF